MRRLVLVLAGALATMSMIGLMAAPATAATDALNRQVSGPFSGVQDFDFSTPRCSFVHQTFDLRYRVGPRHGTVHIDSCVDFSNGTDFTYQGRFHLVSPTGATLDGTVTGRTDGNVDGALLELTLTPTSGTHEFRRVAGTITGSGTWSNDANSLGHGPATGTLDGHLVRCNPWHGVRACS